RARGEAALAKRCGRKPAHPRPASTLALHQYPGGPRARGQPPEAAIVSRRSMIPAPKIPGRNRSRGVASAASPHTEPSGQAGRLPGFAARLFPGLFGAFLGLTLLKF